MSSPSRAVATVLGVTVALVTFTSATPAHSAVADLVPWDGEWKYKDDGSDQGQAWPLPNFDDTAWPAGPAELGYGEGDERTRLRFGTNGLRRHITTYFRHTFAVADAASFTNLTLEVLRDDGVIVYLNGAEVLRDNLPFAAIHHLTPALRPINCEDEEQILRVSIPSELLTDGTNVIAAEVHQDSPQSLDLSFNLRLMGEYSVALTRGPYLQLGTTNEMTIRWRTDHPSPSWVNYGLTLPGLHAHVQSDDFTTEHEIRLRGLMPNTRYYYTVGTSDAVLAGGTEFRFTTAPNRGKPSRVWVLGDSGTASPSAAAVRDAYAQFTGERETDVWLMLGDNAYCCGADEEYQWAVFDMYPSWLRTSVLWPTIGNHDASAGTGIPPMLDIFSLPARGEAGGVASGTERYYSFDYGDLHFVCLDSTTSDRSPDGPMASWLRADLEANTRPWVTAYWHHPPYSRGSHDSDFEWELVEMRQNIVPILESFGADLVLCGHSHSYERSFLLAGHYGASDTFDETFKLDSSSGRADESGPYVKRPATNGTGHGTVYVVAGSSGQISGGSLNYPAMFLSLNELGSLVLDFDGPRVEAKFVTADGEIHDHFTLEKPIAPSQEEWVVTYRFANGQLHLQWPATEGKFYRVERSTRWDPPNWHSIGEGQSLGDGQSWTTTVQSSDPAAFFRVVKGKHSDATNSRP